MENEKEKLKAIAQKTVEELRKQGFEVLPIFDTEISAHYCWDSNKTDYLIRIRAASKSPKPFTTEEIDKTIKELEDLVPKPATSTKKQPIYKLGTNPLKHTEFEPSYPAFPLLEQHSVLCSSLYQNLTNQFSDKLHSRICICGGKPNAFKGAMEAIEDSMKTEFETKFLTGEKFGGVNIETEVIAQKDWKK